MQAFSCQGNVKENLGRKKSRDGLELYLSYSGLHIHSNIVNPRPLDADAGIAVLIANGDNGAEAIPGPYVDEREASTSFLLSLSRTLTLTYTLTHTFTRIVSPTRAIPHPRLITPGGFCAPDRASFRNDSWA